MIFKVRHCDDLLGCGAIVCSACYLLGLAVSCSVCPALGENNVGTIVSYVSSVFCGSCLFVRIVWCGLRVVVPVAVLGFTSFGIFAIPAVSLIFGFVGGFSVYSLCAAGVLSSLPARLATFAVLAALLLYMFSAYEASGSVRRGLRVGRFALGSAAAVLAVVGLALLAGRM